MPILPDSWPLSQINRGMFLQEGIQPGENARLELYFTGRERLELERLFFNHPLIKESRFLVRGRAAANYTKSGMFAWSSAVQAFCLLIIKSAMKARKNHCSAARTGNDFVPDPYSALVGVRKSPARSLDYALSKRPNWLQDIFGFDSKGNSNIYRFFYRINPEGKRDGPVVVALNCSMLPPDKIHIFNGNSEVTEINELVRMFDNIMTGGRFNAGLNINASENRTQSSKEQASGDMPVARSCSLVPCDLRSHVKALIESELLWSLNSTSIFSKDDLAAACDEISGNQLFRRIAGKSSSKLESLINSSTSPVRMGLAGLQAESPLIKLLGNRSISICSCVIEAAINQGSFSKQFGIAVGDRMSISFDFDSAVERGGNPPLKADF